MVGKRYNTIPCLVRIAFERVMMFLFIMCIMCINNRQWNAD
jgi:hypothetical protein